MIKQTFLQRRHNNGQEAHEKMLNITNYQGNAEQNCSEVSLHIEWPPSKKKKKIYEQ